MLFKFCVNISLQYLNYHILSFQKKNFKNESVENSISSRTIKTICKKICYLLRKLQIDNLKKKKKNEESSSR